VTHPVLRMRHHIVESHHLLPHDRRRPGGGALRNCLLGNQMTGTGEELSLPDHEPPPAEGAVPLAARRVAPAGRRHSPAPLSALPHLISSKPLPPFPCAGLSPARSTTTGSAPQAAQPTTGPARATTLATLQAGSPLRRPSRGARSPSLESTAPHGARNRRSRHSRSTSTGGSRPMKPPRSLTQPLGHSLHSQWCLMPI
jgi:hypothetical protein